MASQHTVAAPRSLLNKVPEVTIYFWIIKVLCTTVGETAADFLNVDLGFGLTGTSIVTGIVLIAILSFQFRATRYVPGLYWTTVALISVFGTLVTDNLSDNLGVPLEVSTVVFGVILGIVFLAWYRSEHTLSIHTIVTRRRETFYWLAVLFTFALGTATGDLMSQALSLGYVVSTLIVAGLIAVLAVGWRLGLHPVLAFWVIYILTRPLGASLGDLLAQPADQGGLGLGSTITSLIFLLAILGVVVYLSVTRADVIPHESDEPPSAEEGSNRHGLLQTVVLVAVLLLAGGLGYGLRVAALQNAPAADTSTSAASPGVAANASLGDLSSFRVITQDTLDRLDSGDQPGATARVTDLETAWDQAQGRLQAKDEAAWTRIDGRIDTVLTTLRSSTPDPGAEKAALTALLAQLG